MKIFFIFFLTTMNHFIQSQSYRSMSRFLRVWGLKRESKQDVVCSLSLEGIALR